MPEQYWTIEYTINFLSDFHVGAGITLLGGNRYGLKTDGNGYPFLDHTEVRGLLRLGGFRLKEWHSAFSGLFTRNFGDKDKPSEVMWSYTSARYPAGEISSAAPRFYKLLSMQSHVKIEDATGTAANLFSYQKAGATGQLNCWQGRIFSTMPATEEDVAFMIACMRADDRVGHRRSRGYGKVAWHAEKVLLQEPGKKDEEPFVEEEQVDWLKILLDQEAAQ